MTPKNTWLIAIFKGTFSHVFRIFSKIMKATEMLYVSFDRSEYWPMKGLTLFTISYFTDDSPSGGVVITTPQAKSESIFFLHQIFSLRGVRVSIADFGFEGPGFKSR